MAPGGWNKFEESIMNRFVCAGELKTVAEKKPVGLHYVLNLCQAEMIQSQPFNKYSDT